jgi:hypothetical protein
VTLRIIALLGVAFLSACGGRTPPPSAPNRAAAPRVQESNTSDDYVVGPFVTKPPSKDEQGVRTYYIVRN